jgi:hypothetical protein
MRSTCKRTLRWLSVTNACPCPPREPRCERPRCLAGTADAATISIAEGEHRAAAGELDRLWRLR